MDPNGAPAMVEKVGKTLRLIGYVIQNGVSKSKVMHDLQFLMKQGKSVRKAFRDVMIRRRRSMSCRSCDVQVSLASPGTLSCGPLDSQVPFVSPMRMGCAARDADLSYISPIEYQFSCSGSPPHRSLYLSHISKRKTSTHPHSRRKNHPHRLSHSLSSSEAKRSGSGYFGDVSHGNDSWLEVDRIPHRVTDLEGNWHVDEAAEDFIDRFYRELRLQKWFAAREASDYYYY